jgi:hypothetical protein
MDSPEFVGSDTKERGTWLSLLRYCIGQENGGTISGCKSWKDRQWQQLARVTLREVSGDCRLYSWNGESLIVWGYPKEKESEVIHKRETARLNGKTGGRPKTGSKTETKEEPTLVISPKAEGNGMEGEGERNTETPLPPAGDVEGSKQKSEQAQPAPANEQAKSDPKAKGPLQLRAEKIMGRRPDTPLTPKERKAFSGASAAIKATTEDDWLVLEAFYAAPQKETFSRKALEQLLNNWNGEIDRAKAWAKKPKPAAFQRTQPIIFV